MLTNNHVIDGATDIQVEIGGNGTTKPAKIVGYDATDDIAVIKIKNVSNLKTIDARRLVDASRSSDPVIAIGNALGKGGDPTRHVGHRVAGSTRRSPRVTTTAATRRPCAT